MKYDNNFKGVVGTALVIDSLVNILIRDSFFEVMAYFWHFLIHFKGKCS